ncbi:CotH kinase family protein [Saccharicrinis sp. FJH2]|uniref:CotH kinase family protein n=1 Tax=Saccharicrinis sp. FJH65 TaxID=3344659 RepID=UPI0035F44756
MKFLVLSIVLPLLLLVEFSLSGQVIINEFLASNTGIITDPDYNESSDWVELYNQGNTVVDLSGYYLTDNLSNKDKWQIPSGTSIAPNSFLIIWTDGYNSGLHTSFKLSASGEEIGLFTPDSIPVDSLIYGLQEVNISMGRTSDGAGSWGYFTSPTPGATNNTTSYDGIVKNKPTFEPLGGIFKTSVSVTIKNTFGGTVRYTLDGSVPTESSPVVDGMIDVTETGMLRARIFKPGMVPGEVITHTYFIDPNNEIGKLPVISLATDPGNFWDADTGIYVQSFKPDWEVPVNVELFENDGSDRAAFNLQAGTKVNGLYSWQLPQKMLGIYFRKEYGKGKLDYPLFSDRARNVFDSFALRASGSDWSYTLFRDALSQHLMKLNSTVDVQGYKPCVVYVNGQYMGIHNIRSKVDEDFILENHDIGPAGVDMVENEDYAEAGTLDQYQDFMALYNKDLTVQANYDAVVSSMDLDNFTDFVITEIYVRNSSLDHNVMAWKPRDGGIWKWILVDMDRGFFNPSSSMISYFENEGATPFTGLMKNQDYVKYFGRRLADQFFTSFNQTRVNRIIDEFKARISDEIPDHINRWQGATSSYGDAIPSIAYWEDEVDALKAFAAARPDVILADLKNYGFQESSPLSVSSIPAGAGKITFNGLLIDASPNVGSYPLDEPIRLKAEAKSGYTFKGWIKPQLIPVFGIEQTWKYNDSGNDLGSTWKENGFDDQIWASGQAELGYGDGDENTVVAYTGGSNNKNITTYFRKTFDIADKSSVQQLRISLKCDDGAVVYINGTEVARENMPSGVIGYNTEALVSVGGVSEDDYSTYLTENTVLVDGTNTIAVEIHQSSATSSDISFDLSLDAYQTDQNSFYSTSNEITTSQTGNLSLTAVFEENGQCVLPAEITNDMILSMACSPYVVPDNVTVAKGATLTVEPGVEIWMDDGISMTVNGRLNAEGTETAPIFFTSNPDSPKHKWSILRFVGADTSRLSYVVVENASIGNHSVREVAAISAFSSILIMDHMTLENNHANPIAARYSDITLTNSSLHSEITGDLINVKYGKGHIYNSSFRGNDMPDTDAIDYDDVRDGVIRNCVIHNFFGSNSDAIDIGEKCQNITIDSVFVYNITDKSVSVGQQSSVKISQSVFTNCTLGAGLKDSSNVTIDHCTYYGVNTAVASYEKNVGDAGGNGIVTSSVLSNTYDETILVDPYSSLKVMYSASDNDTLPANNNNYFMDPILSDPNTFDLSLSHYSPCFNKGLTGNIGADVEFSPSEHQPYISRILYNSDASAGEVEYVVISNPETEPIDMSGYRITKGVTFVFPENTTLGGNGELIITNNAALDFWAGYPKPLYQWESGRLANEGETIRLVSSTGIIADQVKYKNGAPWPVITSAQGIVLASSNLDNHFGKNWQSYNNNTWVGLESKSVSSEQEIYPNPTSGLVTISGLQNLQVVEVYTVTGKLVKTSILSASANQIDLSNLSQGVYLVKAGTFQQKVIKINE